MPRYLIIQPDVQTPTGGNAVALQMAKILRDGGYDANTVQGLPDYEYPFASHSMTPYYYPPLTNVGDQFMRRRDQLLKKACGLIKRPAKATNILLTPRPDDVFVVPEFLYPEYCAMFPDHRHILLCQGVMIFCNAFLRDGLSGPRHLDSFEAMIAISHASKRTVDVFSGRQSYLVCQSVWRTSLDPKRKKKRQICYMPRRRVAEQKVIEKYLETEPALQDWDVCRIENMTQTQVDDILSDSLIFLSFSFQEGFGLPPAEAMAAGCIVIGYTGVGGEEFFNETTGIPILDADIAEFATAIKRATFEYDADPTRLDSIRRTAAAHIAKTYTPDAMTASLTTAWADIDAKLSKGP